ncbi:MAG TPA: IS200/IS605 family transposase [Ktedonobacterales bacterium]|nr:IS200/IS605 family transposase [Ktedonobacterales bacterium]
MRHTRINVLVHLVWATWDRQPLLTEPVQRSIRDSLAATCAKVGVEMIACGGIEDHLHLLVRLPANVTLAMLVQRLKGASAHLMTHEINPSAFFKWQGGYGAFSVSPRHLDAVCEYIRRQREHHSAHTTIAAYEPGEDND